MTGWIDACAKTERSQGGVFAPGWFAHCLSNCTGTGSVWANSTFDLRRGQIGRCGYAGRLWDVPPGADARSAQGRFARRTERESHAGDREPECGAEKIIAPPLVQTE